MRRNAYLSAETKRECFLLRIAGAAELGPQSLLVTFLQGDDQVVAPGMLVLG
jgi:hypothetical protein